MTRKSSVPDNGSRSFTRSVYISAFFIHKRKQQRRSGRNYTQSTLHTAAQDSQYTVHYALPIPITEWQSCALIAANLGCTQNLHFAVNGWPGSYRDGQLLNYMHVPRCTLLYYTVLCCTVIHCITIYYINLYIHHILHCINPYITVQYTVLYCIVKY